MWTLLSGTWSDAPGRAVVEYVRVLLYVLLFVACAAAGRDRQDMRWAARGVATGIAVVCVAGLVAQLAPDVLEPAPNAEPGRLGHPVTYWNAMGLLAATGLLVCTALSADLRERAPLRVLWAGLVPVLAAVLLLTFSRGAIAAGAAGAVIVVLAGRGRGLPTALLAALPPAAWAVVAAEDAELLASATPTSAAAIAQGHDLAPVIAACAAVAVLLRTALLPVDRRLAAVQVPARLRDRRTVLGGAAAVAATGLAVALLAGAPGAFERQIDRFTAGDTVEGVGSSRLTQAGNNGRVDQWDVALQAFADEPLRGTGAGTYALRWDLDRPQTFQVEDAHSLYLEVLGELGVVGLVLLAAAVLLLLAGLARVARGPDRGPGAALLAGGVAWALHAGIDWDWELPAVTAWVMAAGGLCLAAAPEGGPRRLGTTARVLAGLGCLVVALLPLRLQGSHSALQDSRDAFARGDCRTAVDRALDAVEGLGARAEPHVVIGVCDVRLGVPRAGVRALERAVARDPHNWEMHYDLALVRAAAGLDPRGSLQRAARLNPREPLVTVARRHLGDDPAQWRRRALSAPLPTE
ncbi:MAG TPA: O-antigen ligase family protein [Baekduia sp.]|nr:O-antigen ligase family protein [Baekduia sp.]